MLLMVVYFFGVKDSPAVKAMLQAVRPVVVGLLLWTAYDMAYSVFSAKKLGWSGALLGGWDKVLIVFAAFALLTLTKISPVLIILGSAAFGFLVYR
jgi:chromate transporter